MNFTEKKILVRGMSDHQKDIVRSVNDQHDDGILRIVSGSTKDGTTNKAKRMLRAVLSSETVDRYGDVIKASAFNNERNFKNYFEGNPQLLWAHNRDSSVPQLPIGSVKNPTFDGKDGNGNLAFEGDVIFSETHQHACDVANCYLADDPSLRAFSVGFRALEVGKEPVQIGQTGYTYLKVDLLENSAVPIPANPAALRKAFISGAVSEEFLERTFFKMRDEILVRNADIFVPSNWSYKESLNEMAKLATEIRSGSFSVNRELDAKIERKEPAAIVIKETYHCINCDKDSQVEMNSFPEKSYHGNAYRDAKCEHCGSTTEQCIEAMEVLLSMKSN